MIPFLKSSTKSDNEIKVHMSPWDLGMAPGRQPCNVTYTKEQTPALHRMLTQGSAEHLLLSSAAASCMGKGSHGLLPTQLPDKRQEPQGLGLCFGGCCLWNVPRSHGLVGCKFLGTLHMLL